MRQRIDKLGVSEPVITRQGTDQISVQLAGIHDSGRAAEIIGQTAQLQFFDLQADALPPTAGARRRDQPFDSALCRSCQGSRRRRRRAPRRSGTSTRRDKTRLAGPSETKEDILRQFGGEQPEGSTFYAVPQGKIVLTCTDTRDALSRRRGAGSGGDLLLPLQVRAEQRDQAGARADGEGSQR